MQPVVQRVVKCARTFSWSPSAAYCTSYRGSFINSIIHSTFHTSLMHHKLSSNTHRTITIKNRPAVTVSRVQTSIPPRCVCQRFRCRWYFVYECWGFGVIIRLILPLLGPDFSLACNLLNGAQGRTATSLPPTMDGPYRYSPERNTPAVMQ